MFTNCHWLTIEKSEKGNKSVMDQVNFTKCSPGHVDVGHNLQAKYHDPSSNGS